MVISRRPRRTVSRLLLLRVAVALAFIALTVQLWRLQIVQGDDFRWQANNNRFRVLSQEAPRGVIYDRQGRILARNRPRYQVVVIPEDLPREEMEQTKVLRRLKYLLETMPTAEETARTPGKATAASAATPTPWPGFSLVAIQAKIAEAAQASSFRPLLVSSNVRREVALLIEEDSPNLPGVQVQVQARREYPGGSLTAHVIGYTGPIPRESAQTYVERGYLPTAHVGLAGLELTFEDELRGQAGQRAIVVDVHGREVRTVGEPQTPVPGHNLVLTIDLQLQQAVEDALYRGLQAAYRRGGVAVAMDPRNGAVLALVSLPGYDNNLFAEGISVEDYAALSQDIDRPLVNHATSGIYPPGSVFKIIPAAAGLQEEVITPRTLLGDSQELDGANDGVIWLPNRYFPWDRKQDQPFYCWVHKLGYGHGRISLVTAIAESCDIYFYQLAGGYGKFEGLGLDRLDQYALLFGLGQPTGIDLPAENAGLVPDARWKRQTYGENWVTGDTYNVAIGQGYVLATPLQMLNATAAVANDGYLYRPQLVYQITGADGQVLRPFTPELIRELPIAREHLAVVREGMYRAVNWEHGTATKARLLDVAVAGKTGTAEFFVDRDQDGWPDRDAQGHLPTHAWFTAFAPYEEPEIVLVVLVEGGGEGSAVAVPVAAEILRAYFGLQEGRAAAESEEMPTLITEDTGAAVPDEASHGQ